MPEERHFLAAIRKNPDDRLPRLVYADWLDEQGDPRGELVRIEEAVRTTPIHSDLYWKLKPRRRELLPLAPRPWLKKMGYDDGNVYRPMFADIPDGWKERWRLLREFVERWYQIPMPDVGGPLRPPPPPRDQHDRAHGQKLDDTLNNPKASRKLPPSLREWMYFIRDLQLGVRDFGGGSGDGHIFWDLDGHLSFLQHDGGREHYFIRREDQSEADPPVWWDWSNPTPGRSSRLIAPRLTTVALDFLADQYSLPGVGERREKEKLTKKLDKQLANAFTARSAFDEAVIFERDNAFAIHMPALLRGGIPSLVIRSRTEAVRREVDDAAFG